MSNLKRTPLPILLFTLSLLILLALVSCINILTVSAQTDTLSSVDIQVDHTVEIKDGGLVVINDTIRLSTEQGQNIEPLQNFSIGFPFEYKSNLDYCFAYDASNHDERLEVVLDVGLGRIGLYGVNVLFPESGINIGGGGSYNFTVVFVFSNLISSKVYAAEPNGEEAVFFTVDFPLYPSVTQDVSTCNVTVILPYGANYTTSSFEENGLAFNTTTHDLHQAHRLSDNIIYLINGRLRDIPLWNVFSTDLCEANGIKKAILGPKTEISVATNRIGPAKIVIDPKNIIDSSIETFVICLPNQLSTKMN